VRQHVQRTPGEFEIQSVILIFEFLAVFEPGGRIIQHSLIYGGEVLGDELRLLRGEGQFVACKGALSALAFIGRDTCQPLRMVGLVAGLQPLTDQ